MKKLALGCLMMGLVFVLFTKTPEALAGYNCSVITVSQAGEGLILSQGSLEMGLGETVCFQSKTKYDGFRIRIKGDNVLQSLNSVAGSKIFRAVRAGKCVVVVMPSDPSISEEGAFQFKIKVGR